MDLWYGGNIDDLLSDDESLDSVAMSFFSILGHSCASTPLHVDNDPLHFVYGTLATEIVLSQSVRDTLLLVKNISLLFILNGSIFCNAKGNTIEYFAVDLAVPRDNRSTAASEIQLMIAKLEKANIVTLFRNEDAYMLSFSLKSSDGKGKVVLSDWFSDGSHDDVFYESLAAFNFSFGSASAFYLDFCQAAARYYYTYPCSRDLARYELVPAIWGTDNPRESFTREDMSDMLRSILLKPLNEYGDDYIDDELISDYSSDEFENTDFDLLEYELEQMGAFDDDYQDASFEDEIELASQASSNQNPSFDSSSIPADIMRDPVKLLAWIDEHDRDPDNRFENRLMINKTISSENLLIEALELEDLDYIDNRAKGGVFWIIGGPEISLFIDDISTKLGYKFTFKPGGGRATTGEDAWWTKQPVEA